MQPTIAYLILSHHLPGLAARLVGALQHPRAVFCLHVDAKASLKPYLDALPVPLPENVFFLDQRSVGHWGTFSLVQASLNALQATLQRYPQVGHLALLSGQSYPLVGAAAVVDRLQAQGGRSFVQAEPMDETHEYYRRFRRHFFWGKHYIPVPPPFPFSFPFSDQLNRLCGSRLRQRAFPRAGKPWFGSQWWCMCNADAHYVLNFCRAHPEWLRFFRTTSIPDETFFQSTLWGTRPPDQTGHLLDENLHFINWERTVNRGRSPATLTCADLPAMRASGALFARKFDPTVDALVLDELDAASSGG